MYLKTQIENLLRLAQEQESYEPYFEVLESITFTGDEYFDTEGYGNQNTTWEVECRATDTSNYGVVLGARTATNQNRIDLIYSTDGTSGWIGFGTNSNNTYNFKNLPANVRHNFKCDEGKVYIDGELKTTISHTNFGTPVTIKIGCEDTNGTLSMGFVGELYVLKLNGSDYVPVLDNQMRPCLYNRTTKTFTYAKKISDGTTTYDLGFKRWNKYDVDYIESSGTQYIDSGLLGTQDSAVFADVMLNTYSGTTTQRIFGNYYSTSNALTMNCNSNTTVRFDGKTATQATCPDLVLTPNTRHVVGIDKTGIKIDNEYKYTWVGAVNDFVTGGNVILLASSDKVNPQPSTIKNGLEGRCYGIWWVENGTLVRDYKPVVWHNGDTTAEACWYDEVYNKMYQNAGTGSFKAYIVGADDTVYEVGMYIQTMKTSTQATIGPIIELGEYPQDGIGYHIKTTTDSDSSNYLFGSRLTTSGNLQIVTLSGSSTGATILSTVMGESITWKSGTTTWARSSNGTTYECSIQTYKDGNTYKFNAIGYNYTLGKEADRQTQTYANSIDGRQNVPMLYFGAFNTANILFGTNSHYFIEWNLPDVRHTLLPVINTAHTQFCFIDNKSKEIYEFRRVGAYTPTTNNISFKQLDGTIITGTL